LKFKKYLDGGGGAHHGEIRQRKGKSYSGKKRRKEWGRIILNSPVQVNQGEEKKGFRKGGLRGRELHRSKGKKGNCCGLGRAGISGGTKRGKRRREEIGGKELKI